MRRRSAPTDLLNSECNREICRFVKLLVITPRVFRHYQRERERERVEETVGGLLPPSLQYYYNVQQQRQKLYLNTFKLNLRSNIPTFGSPVLSQKCSNISGGSIFLCISWCSGIIRIYVLIKREEKIGETSFQPFIFPLSLSVSYFKRISDKGIFYTHLLSCLSEFCLKKNFSFDENE